MLFFRRRKLLLILLVAVWLVGIFYFTTHMTSSERVRQERETKDEKFQHINEENINGNEDYNQNIHIAERTAEVSKTFKKYSLLILLLYH